VSVPRLSSRDYKRTRRTPMRIDFARVREFAIGLAVGLCIAGVVYLAAHRAPDASAEAPRPTPRKSLAKDAGATAAEAAASATTAGATEDKYDFYTMLPKFEVVVPEKERGTRVAPAAQIDRPGIYFLQVGSYRDSAVAERIRAQLGKLGIDAAVQRVAVDTDVWHRVRVGPIRDLTQLNHLRQQLQASDLDSLVIRVDE